MYIRANYVGSLDANSPDKVPHFLEVHCVGYRRADWTLETVLVLIHAPRVNAESLFNIIHQRTGMRVDSPLQTPGGFTFGPNFPIVTLDALIDDLIKERALIDERDSLTADQFATLIRQQFPAITIDAIDSCLIEDTDIGQIIFYDRDGQQLANIEGRGQPIETALCIDWIKANWIPERDNANADPGDFLGFSPRRRLESKTP